jgi:uncharacterized protein
VRVTPVVAALHARRSPSMAAQRSGSADLPLHGGRVPRWLAERMSRLGRVIVEAIVLEYGRDELLRRLAHPFWFQSFGALMGMDWHSSGITTAVIGTLKRGLAPVAHELGVHVCGGRGTQSRRTPSELLAVGERTGVDGDALARTSRLVAKIDSAAVQDGFQLYLHGFVVTDDGRWVVVQQGMRPETRRARRYHWLSEGLTSFLDDPHAAVEGTGRGVIVNLADARAGRSRAAQLDVLSRGPERVVTAYRRALARPASALAALADDAIEAHDPSGRAGAAPSSGQLALPYLTLPSRHDVRRDDVVLRRLHGALAAAADRAPADFPELLLTPGVGARTVLALALAAEVIHGTPCRFSDPARFSLALGGKDGQPFPVPLHVYDRTLAVLRRAVDAARLSNDDRLSALRRLDDESRRLERVASGPSFDDHVAAERAASDSFGGRSVVAPHRRSRERS